MIKKILIFLGVIFLGLGVYFFTHQRAGEKILEEPVVEEEIEVEETILAPDEKYEIYFDDENLISNNIETGKKETIMTLYDDVGGFSIIGWNPSGTKLAIAAMNWESPDYPDLTKLFVLEIEEGKIKKKDKFNFVFAFECDDRGCFYFDIDWKNDTELEYRTWDFPGGTPYDTEGDPSYRRVFSL